MQNCQSLTGNDASYCRIYLTQVQQSFNTWNSTTDPDFCYMFLTNLNAYLSARWNEQNPPNTIFTNAGRKLSESDDQTQEGRKLQQTNPPPPPPPPRPPPRPPPSPPPPPMNIRTNVFYPVDNTTCRSLLSIARTAGSCDMTTYDRSFSLTVAGSACGLVGLLILVFFATCSNPPEADPEELRRRISERASADQPWRLREWAYGRTTIARMRYDSQATQSQAPAPTRVRVSKPASSSFRRTGTMTQTLEFQ